MDITNLSVKQAIFTHAEGNELRIRLCSSSYFLSRRERPISYWFGNQEPINRSLYLLYILCLGVNPFPSRFIYRTALRGGFARTQFKDPIKTELDRVYCFTSHSPMI